ncbi:MAG: MBOAT family protein, partial [Actinomycetia bacterium]|nr:MBOAT family protein [Actinomycetes bacterium]
MVFSSLAFLCVFLPVVFLLYLLAPGTRAKNVLLIAASLVFYAYGEPVYILLLLASAVLNWIFGQLIGARPDPRSRKLMLAVSVAVNLGFLVVFKYAGWLVSLLNGLLGTHGATLHLALPIGISFYTFQALTYVIDVYRRTAPPQRNFLKLLLYISLFPQLLAGPIIKYHDIEG